MKTFYITWTYIANHSNKYRCVRAESAEDALQDTLDMFSEDFARKACVMVWEHLPAIEYDGPNMY